MKIKIYFWKHGFQTTDESLWCVQRGNQTWYTRKVEIITWSKTMFAKTNPHAYIEIIKRAQPATIHFDGWVCNSSTKTCHYKLITIS